MCPVEIDKATIGSFNLGLGHAQESLGPQADFVCFGVLALSISCFSNVIQYFRCHFVFGQVSD